MFYNEIEIEIETIYKDGCMTVNISKWMYEC